MGQQTQPDQPPAQPGAIAPDAMRAGETATAQSPVLTSTSDPNANASADLDPRNRYFRTDHLQRDLKGRTLRSGITTIAGQLIKFSVQVGSTVALARILSPSDFGLIAMVTAMSGFFLNFRDMGLSQATIQRPNVTHEEVTNLFWVNAAVGLVVGIIVACLAPVIAWFYNEPRLIPVTLVMSTFSILGGLAVQHAALLQRQMQFTPIVIRDVGGQLFGFLAGLFAAWQGAGYWSLVVMTGSQQLFALIALWTGCRWRPSLPFWKTNVRPMLVFGSNLSGNSIINYFGANIDSVLIGYFFGAAQLGFYSRAMNLLLLPMRQILPPMSSVMMPALSRIADDTERFRRVFLGFIERVAMISLPAITFMIFASDWIIILLLGRQWVECSPIFAWLGLNALTQPINALTTTTWVARGHGGAMLRWGIVHNLLIITAIVAGLPWGPVGVAASYAISGLLLRVPYFYWCVSRNNVFSLTDLLGRTGPHYLIAGVIFASLFAVRRELGDVRPIMGLAITLPLAIAIWAAITMALPSTRKCLLETTSLLTKRVKHKVAGAAVT
jgi:O-antigen/teichoic acid export membrane protein